MNAWSWQMFRETRPPSHYPWECRQHSLSEELSIPPPPFTKVSLNQQNLIVKGFREVDWIITHGSHPIILVRKNYFPHTMNKFIWLQLNHIPLVVFSGEAKSGCSFPQCSYPFDTKPKLWMTHEAFFKKGSHTQTARKVTGRSATF